MSYIPLPIDINNNVLTTVSQQEIFGQILMAQRFNQITANFFKGSPEDSALISTSGGATATSGSGKALFQTSSAVTASVTATSNTNISYSPGYEIYTIFTVTFTTPTDTNSTQYAGLWDVTNNGFYMGYKGTVFGTLVMTGGVETFTPRSSWNVDLLNGAAGSKFTRNGTPEAINFNFLNLFRIRFGWLGAAPILYEVCSPDGEWVLFNIIKEPNTTANTSIQSPDLPVTIQVTKTGSDVTNLAMSCACWASGTAAPLSPEITNFDQENWTSATLGNTALATSSLAAGDCSFSVIITGVVSAGVITFETTPDGTNWFPLYLSDPFDIPSIINTYDLSNGSATWLKQVGGYIEVRMRLSTPITGAGSVQVMIRPSSVAGTQFVQVLQSTGTNLHTVVDKVALTGQAPTAISVGVTSGTVLVANALRKGATFTNTSTNTISFGLDGNAAVLNSGITLAPYGSWIMDDYTFTTGLIKAIASGAASNLSVQELQ